MQQQQLGIHGSLDISRLPQNLWRELHRNDKKEPAAFQNWIKMNFSGIGTPRRGLVEGALPYFAMRSMGSLREVYLSGCEQIHDWEIEILASVCSNSLTCLEMRACCIGDPAIRAVGVHCNSIADLDFSACFEITDTGVISFCQYQGVRTRDRSTVRSLKLANLSRLTDQSIRAISSLEALLVLDVHNCQSVSTEAIAQTASNLHSLVELEAKGIGQWNVAAAVSKSIQEGEKPNQLRFINGRPCNNKHKDDNNDQKTTGSCFKSCMVRKQSKRLLSSQGVSLQPMFHCIDCKLTPSYNRGLCHACVSHCHSGHKTFVGSYTRFYCDCPFGIATDNMQPVVCQLIADYET
jgi:hypothetical protein